MSALDEVAAISYAASVAYELGHAHGRRDERLLIEQEHRSAEAGRIVAALAEVPPRDREADRAAAARREERWAERAAAARCTVIVAGWST